MTRAFRAMLASTVSLTLDARNYSEAIREDRWRYKDYKRGKGWHGNGCGGVYMPHQGRNVEYLTVPSGIVRRRIVRTE